MTPVSLFMSMKKYVCLNVLEGKGKCERLYSRLLISIVTSGWWLFGSWVLVVVVFLNLLYNLRLMFITEMWSALGVCLNKI